MKKLLTVLLIVSLTLTSSAFAISGDNINSSEKEQVIFEAHEEFSPAEIRDRIEKGITDAPKDKITIDVSQNITGPDGADITFVGETTQLLKTTQKVDGSKVNEYSTTSVFDITVGSLPESSSKTNTTNQALNADVADPTYSIEMYINTEYADGVIESSYVGKITHLHAYYMLDDSSVSATGLSLYDMSYGYRVWDSSYNYLGTVNYSTNPRLLYQRSNPNALTVYYVPSSSLTGYWVPLAAWPAPAEFLATRAVFTLTRGSSTWTGTITQQIFNDGDYTS